MTSEELSRIVDSSWVNFLLSLFNDPKMLEIQKTLGYLKQNNRQFYPETVNVFRVFRETKYEDVRVIIIGQDPYINKGEATGLAFAVPLGTTKLPPSLRIIFEELEYEYDIDVSPNNCDLLHWSKQGVLLLNTALTVEAGKSNSHSQLWSWFIEAVIQKLQEDLCGLIFIQWGKEAQKYKINEFLHTCLKSSHPMVEIYGSGKFLKNNHFKIVNEIITGQNGPEFQISWIKQH